VQGGSEKPGRRPLLVKNARKYTSQVKGSAATRLRRDEIFNDMFITESLMCLTVK